MINEEIHRKRVRKLVCLSHTHAYSYLFLWGHRPPSVHSLVIIFKKKKSAKLASMCGRYVHFIKNRVWSLQDEPIQLTT